VHPRKVGVRGIAYSRFTLGRCGRCGRCDELL